MTHGHRLRICRRARTRLVALALVAYRRRLAARSGACADLSEWVKGVTIVHPTAEIAASAVVDPAASVWQFVHVREGARIGAEAVIGRGAYIGPGVRIGARCKVQNYALIYEPADIADGVFIGPHVVLTNDRFPRAVNPDGTLQSAADWDPVGVTVRDGASIGARSVCVAPVVVGRWALVAAGSVVVRDVPDFALVAGAPARRLGWVGRAGVPLEQAGPGEFTCPRTGARYREASPDLLEEVPA